MLIDWFTVGAQIVNFLVLVWLMKRYLYQPILRAIDAREQHLATELTNAESSRLAAEQAKAEYQQKTEQLEAQRRDLLQQATEEAEAERRRLLDEARHAASTLAAQRHQALVIEARNLSIAVLHRTREEVFALTRKALEALTSSDLEDRLVEVFIRRLSELDVATKVRLTTALSKGQCLLLLRSAFAPAASQRQRLESALNETLATKCSVSYEVSPAIVCGIELVVDGHKVAWSIPEYLSTLEQGVLELIDQHLELVRSQSDHPAPPSTHEHHA